MVTIIATAISSATAVAVALIAAQAGHRKAAASGALTDCREQLEAMERALARLVADYVDADRS